MLGTRLVNSLLPYPLPSALARALLTPFQLLASSGSYRINSLVYIYPDTVQLCHRLNTLCSPEFNTIHGNLSGIKQSNCNIRLVFSSLKRSYWRLPKYSKPGKKERSQRGTGGKGEKELSDEVVHAHHTQGLASCVQGLQWWDLFRSASRSVKQSL